MWGPLQAGLGELLPLIANYGFAIVMAILMWRFITDTQKENTKALNSLEKTMAELRMELNYMRDYQERQEERDGGN